MPSPGPNDLGQSRYHIMRGVEASLKRLGTDYIDLYYLHTWDRITPVDEVMHAMDDAVRAGKIRYVGCRIRLRGSPGARRRLPTGAASNRSRRCSSNTR